jgi:RNA polymerase sigma-70 factor (ECF subfamily)
MIDVTTAKTGELLKALRQDKDAVFAELVAAHHAAMLTLARTILGADECEEAVQEAWISAYRGIEGFEGRSSFRTWLTRIVINQARGRLRKGGREFNVDAPAGDFQDYPGRFGEGGGWSIPPREWGYDSPEDLLQEQNLLDCLHKHLGILPSNQRLAVELRDVQGLELDDICNMLEISASNARVLLHRARTQLFNMVDHYQETGEC